MDDGLLQKQHPSAAMSEKSSPVDSVAPTIRDSFSPTRRTGDPSPTNEDGMDSFKNNGSRVSFGGGEMDGKLSWTDKAGNTYYYKDKPLTRVCPFILSQEMCERLAFYGLMPTLKGFLKKTLGVSDAEASSDIGLFSGLIMLFPIVSAAISDTYLGAFRTILVFSAIYGSGLALIDLAAIESISSPWMVYVSLYVLITIGSGGIKSCVNVFGGQQMHPEEHKPQIETFFMYFYASINAGSIIGGLAVPQTAESVSYFVAYLIPVSFFVLACIVFVSGSGRYVKIKPQGSAVVGVLKVCCSAICNKSIQKTKMSRGGNYEDGFVDDVLKLLRLMPVCAMTVPLMVAYNQMTTAFLTQGEKMDASIGSVHFAPELMQTVDPVAVILSSLVVERLVFPQLEKMNKMPTAMTRFAIGNIIGVLSLLCAFGVELAVMHQTKPNTISIWWQVPQFSLIALAEIFVISTSYEVAFTLAPAQLKTVASACNLLFFSLAGFLSSFLFLICAGWMPDYDKDKPETYQDAHYDYYYLVLAGLCVLGFFGCMGLRSYFVRISTDRRTTGEQEPDQGDALLDKSSKETYNDVE